MRNYSETVLRWRVFAPRLDAPRGWFILAAMPGNRCDSAEQCAALVRATSASDARCALRVSAVYADRIETTDIPPITSERAVREPLRKPNGRAA